MNIEVLKLIQIILAITLIVMILLQNRGAGLSGLFGGGGGGNVYLTKRGFEKKLYYATIAVAITFFATSFLVVTL
jgi:protein translocase SecG subunit